MVLLKRILLIRFSSIGDIVLTTPVVRTIKTQLECELHVLCKVQYKQLFQNNPNVDRVHCIEKNISEVVVDLKKQNFDFVVDLQKNIRSHKLIKALKKPSASFPKLNIEKWILVNLKINKLPKHHIVDRYFEAVKSLGIKNDNKGLDFFYPKEDKIYPSSINKDLANGYIAWVIGGQHFTKIMPAEKVASIASKTKHNIILLGGKEDKKRGEEIISTSSNKSIYNACGNFSLSGSASLVEQSDVVICNDTGLMHIAAAFNKPTISVWGNTVADFGMYPYMPPNNERYIISEIQGLNCRPCSKLGHSKCPKRHFKCMLDQDEELIINSINSFTK